MSNKTLQVQKPPGMGERVSKEEKFGRRGPPLLEDLYINASKRSTEIVDLNPILQKLGNKRVYTKELMERVRNLRDTLQDSREWAGKDHSSTFQMPLASNA